MKNEVFTNPKTGVIRYKIREKKMRRRQSPEGNVSFIYQTPTSLVFSLLRYTPNGPEGSGQGLTANKDTAICLKAKNGKYNMYKIVKDGGGAINCSMNTELLDGMIHYRVTDHAVAVENRAKKVLRRFLKSVDKTKKVNPNLTFKQNVLHLCYPGLTGLSLWQPYKVSRAYSRKLRNTSNIREAIAKIFGTKDETFYQLVYKQIEDTCCLDILALGVLCSKLVPVNDVKDIIVKNSVKRKRNPYNQDRLNFEVSNLSSISPSIAIDVKRMRKFLRRLNVQDRIHFINLMFADMTYNWSASDIVRVNHIYEGKIDLPKTLTNLSSYSTELKAIAKKTHLPTRVCDVPEVALGIDGVEVEDDIRLIVARDTAVVQNWNDALQFDITQDSLMNPDDYYIGVEHGDEIKQLICLTRAQMRIRYFRGEQARNASQEDNNLVIPFLIERGVVDPAENYRVRKIKTPVVAGFDDDDPFADE